MAIIDSITNYQFINERWIMTPLVEKGLYATVGMAVGIALTIATNTLIKPKAKSKSNSRSRSRSRSTSSNVSHNTIQSSGNRRAAQNKKKNVAKTA